MSNLSYYEMYQLHKARRSHRIVSLTFYVVAVILLSISASNYYGAKSYKSAGSNWETTTYYYASGENELTIYQPEEKEVVAKGVCVDKALSVMSIMQRNGKFNDNIKLAVGPAGNSWHVQVVETNGGIPIYYDINDEFNVVVSNHQFNGEPPVFYDPEVFKKIAMENNPLPYTKLRDLSVLYK